MKIFLDTAITAEIERRLDSGVISGVTTNPTLIKKAQTDPDDVYKYLIKDLGVPDLSIEVDGFDAEQLIQNNALQSL